MDHSLKMSPRIHFTLQWILLACGCGVRSDGDSDNSTFRCAPITVSVTVQYLSIYYNDVVSVMATTVSLLPLISRHFDETTGNASANEDVNPQTAG